MLKAIRAVQRSARQTVCFSIAVRAVSNFRKPNSGHAINFRLFVEYFV